MILWRIIGLSMANVVVVVVVVVAVQETKGAGAPLGRRIAVLCSESETAQTGEPCLRVPDRSTYSSVRTVFPFWTTRLDT
jgi:hypothetical protein